MWQIIVTIALVALAAFYVIRKFLRQLRGKEGSNCAFCNCSCKAAKGPQKGTDKAANQDGGKGC